MPKIKVYAKSSGDKNAAILIYSESQVPSGHTEVEPLAPKDGFTVDWNDHSGEWEYNAIPKPETEVAE